jgi:hypothetical protein
LAASTDMALGLLCFLVLRSTKRLAASHSRISSVVASENAHFRWALPIFLWGEPFDLPADSWLPRTRRA